MPAGELAALGTATSWTASSLAFEGAARRIGSLSLNFLRVVLALAWLTVLAVIVTGRAMPAASATQWAYLLASGVVGLVLGDLCTFRAYVLLGAQRTMVFATATPIFTAALAWIALGETVSVREAAGMVVIVAGVVLTIRDRVPVRVVTGVGAHPVRGALLALGGALGQAGGLLLSKRGLGATSTIGDAMAATQIRLLAGIAGFALVLTGARWWSKFGGALKDGRAVALTATGALLGPGIGVSLSLYAVTHASAGVASALMSLTPVLLIPVVLARGDRVGAAGIAGSVLAVAGVVILALA